MVPLGSSYFTVPGRATAPGAGAEPGPTVVWLTGEHDISTDGALSQVLARAMALGATALVIDLSELGFIGASTLGTIVGAREVLRRRSGTLTVRCAPPLARRIIDICGLNDLLGAEEAGKLAGRVRQTGAHRALATSTEGRAQSA